ncbi:transposase [Streptomyces sp. NPDC085944]|uniref:transposase n=1 Tax=Streptomyces sp. NPDC085944 TaxID=3154962 RepID=UPI0034311A47
MPRSLATCAIGRPVVRTSRTARSRNSSGYLRGAGTARGSPSGQDHKPGFRDFTNPGPAHLADKAYSSRAIRSCLRRRGIRAVIPQPADQAANRTRRGRSGGRPPAFDRESYKQRNAVERCINKLKQWRGLATRYDKNSTIYLAGLHVAAIFIWSAR